MTEQIVDLPGFDSILELNNTDPGDWWQSSRLPIKVQMGPELWVPIRAVFGDTGYPGFRRELHLFLCQQMELLALKDVDTGDSPYLESYNLMKRHAGQYFDDIERMQSDYEDFISMVEADYLNAIEAGTINIELSSTDNYRMALAYFAVKGAHASLKPLGVHIPKKRNQRKSLDAAEESSVTRTGSSRPLDNWLPAGMKQEILTASQLLAQRVEAEGTENQPYDLLSDRCWSSLPKLVAQTMAARGAASKNDKTLSNRFAPQSEDYCRQFTVVHYILMN